VIKHEVLHDQLAAAIEKVRQRGPTLWAVEQVFRVDLDHWQPAAISTEGLSLRVWSLSLASSASRATSHSSRDDLRPTHSASSMVVV
jgi:hypothetical protein